MPRDPRVIRTEGGNETFDQAEAHALDLIHSSEFFAIFAVRENGRMEGEVAIPAEIAYETIEDFCQNIEKAIKLVREGMLGDG